MSTERRKRGEKIVQGKNEWGLSAKRPPPQPIGFTPGLFIVKDMLIFGSV